MMDELNGTRNNVFVLTKRNLREEKKRKIVDVVNFTLARAGISAGDFVRRWFWILTWNYVLMHSFDVF
jgi:hypothetical protein